VEAPGIEASESEHGHAESCGVSVGETGTSVATASEANSVLMAVAPSRRSSEVAGARSRANTTSPDAFVGAPSSPRRVAVAELVRAAVAALDGGDVLGARAAARALVEFIEVIAGARQGVDPA
jgi:hypothetical protein